jgi:hypothetical protein
VQWSIDAAFCAALACAWHFGRATLTSRVNEFGFALREVALESGIDFVHRAPTVDARLANIQPHVAGMGAAVSVVTLTRTAGPTCTPRTARPDRRTRCT